MPKGQTGCVLGNSSTSIKWRERMAKPELKNIVLGFLTVRDIESSGLRGGYLLTSEYGRPLEFHYTSVLHISKVQRALHGSGFEPYVYAQVLALPLTERQTTPPQMIVVDHPALLEIRKRIPAPVLLFERESEQLTPHVDFQHDLQAMEKLRTYLPVSFNLHEPFERIEQAIHELREQSAAMVA